MEGDQEEGKSMAIEEDLAKEEARGADQAEEMGARPTTKGQPQKQWDPGEK
jgi:hypothetical protein